jgi:acyl-CoA reductase-like NAD-dependent aldehyde dehydrogenase
MVSKLGARDIVEAVAAAARLWRNRSYVPRRNACRDVAVRTGYAETIVEIAFDRLFTPLDAATIEAVIAAELGSVKVLGEFVAREGAGRVRALPLGRVCVVSSRTTIGVAVVPAIFALCAGCEVLVKDREDRLVSAFFETICEMRPELRDRAAAVFWNGALDAVDLGTFDCVVAFGSNATLATIAHGLSWRTRFIPHGNAASAGYVASAALDDESAARAIAEGAAGDALLYDGEGCMSLHLLFVESGARISSAQFGELLRDAFAQTAARYPASTLPAVTARTALGRDEAMAQASERGVFSDERASYLLVTGSSDDSPPLFVPRAMNLVTVDDPRQAAAYLRRHDITLEALAVCGPGSDVAEFAASCGVTRITRFGAMQAPPPGSPHGGRPQIAEFVRWIADET